MRVSNICVAATVASTLFLMQAPAAWAQNGTQERRIIVKTVDGGDVDVQGDLNGDGVIVFRIAGNDGAGFTFVGSPAELPFGGLLGPMGMAMMAAAGPNSSLNIIDPGVSYIHQLIKRTDVKSELFIDSKQREQLDAMDAAANSANQQKFAQLQSSIQNLKSGNGSSPDQHADAAKSLHELVQGGADEQDKKLAEILTPKQIQRLKELDLQYRGPLAMGVKPVAEKAKVVDPQASVVSDMLKQYREGVRKALGVDEKTTRSTDENGNSSISVRSTFNAGSPDEMRARLAKAHDEIENSRRELGNKALKTITDAQRSEWKKMTGQRFQFVILN